MMDVVASHGVVDDPSRLLKRAGAPYQLSDWASGRRIDVLWEECDRGDWLIWLAAVERIPLWSLVHAAAACATRAVEGLESGRKRLRAAIRAAEKMESQGRVVAHAERCESVAGKPEAERYAQPPPPAERWAASSAALTARAAEGLLRAEARRVAERQAEARHLAGVIGAGDHIMGTSRLPPVTYDVDEQSTQYCVDAAANAVSHAVDALLPSCADEAQIEAAEGKLADVVFALLDPIRRELRAGTDARELVPEINLGRPHKEGQDENAAVVAKKPYIAFIAALVLPGGGHHYAEHRVMGTVLTCTIVGMLVMAILEPGWWSWAMPALMLADAALSRGAVRRRNDKKVMAPRSQLQMGVLLVSFVCIVVWWFFNSL